MDNVRAEACRYRSPTVRQTNQNFTESILFCSLHVNCERYENVCVRQQHQQQHKW